MKQQRMHSDEEDAPLTEHLLEQFAGWYLISVLAVRALEHARSLHARREGGQPDTSSAKP
ncbi:MAG: hypothetical protein ACPHUB_04950 [Candidatus Puniceispirillaceae bacterium]